VRTSLQDDDSFLGVANSVCISFNINTSCTLSPVTDARFTDCSFGVSLSGVLTFLIVALSFLFEQVTHTLKHFSHDTQMQRIIDTLLEEVMILGFISMVRTTCLQEISRRTMITMICG